MDENMNSTYGGEDRREASWHLNKEVTVSTLVAIVFAFLGGVAGYTTLKADVKQIKEKVEIAADTHVEKSTLEVEMRLQQVKLEAVAKDVQENRDLLGENKQTLKENQALMLQLLQRMPVKEGN